MLNIIGDRVVYLQPTILKVIFLANPMIATNTAKNLTLKNKHLSRLVIPIIYKSIFVVVVVKINTEKNTTIQFLETL